MMKLFTTSVIATTLMMTGCVASAPTIESTLAVPSPVSADFPPSLVELNFDSHADRLNGHAYLANGEGPHPTVILLHGFPGNERNLDLAQDLRSAGFNVLFFHYRGAWGSEGTYTVTHLIEDVAAAADYLRENAIALRTNPDRLILVGHSMGGFAALQAAARDDSIQCTAAIAPANLGAVAERFEAEPDAAAGFAAYADTLTMLSGLTGEAAIAEIMANREAFDTRLLAPALVGKSVLLVAGDEDTSVPIETMHLPLVAAYEAEPGIELTSIVLSGDHSFSWSRQHLIDEVLEWAEACR